MDSGAGPACGQSLIGALAARNDSISGPKDGFAGQRKLLHRHDQIHIDGTEDNDHEAVLPLISRWTGVRQAESG